MTQGSAKHVSMSGVNATVFSKKGFSWAAGWRWLSAREMRAARKSGVKRRTAIASIAACGTPYCKGDGNCACAPSPPSPPGPPGKHHPPMAPTTNPPATKCTAKPAVGCRSSHRKGGLAWSWVCQPANHKDMTIDFCLRCCAAAKFAWMGVGDGTQCQCGDADAPRAALPAASCDVKCAGNASETCGGSWANTVHEIVCPKPPPASSAGVDPAQAVAAAVNGAAAAGVAALYAQHAAWWAAYWPLSFVSLPVTRLEGYYYAEMYRFTSSDRVGLHGLMGSFGPSGMFNLWPDDVWDMNEQVMYWLAPASNRRAISEPMLRYLEKASGQGGEWMTHNYIKVLSFWGDDALLSTKGFAMVSKGLPAVGSKKIEGDGYYHINGCSSPEYHCYAPYDKWPQGNPHCKIGKDCNYALSQLNWGLQTALGMVAKYKLAVPAATLAWWKDLKARIVPYPTDHTGYKLDANCDFQCPHRHFSHLFQIFDLETVSYGGGNASINSLIHRSMDNWYGITCNASNWFNEECRGFTQCALTAMNTVSGRRDAAAGNLSGLVDSVITPNGMYGEMVYMNHPDEFCPVSESAYCGAGNIHTMLIHTTTVPGAPVLQFFPGFPANWTDASFHQLRSSGGCLVSASRKKGLTEWLRLKSASEGGRGGAATVAVEVPDDSGWGSQPPKALPASVAVSKGPRAGTWRVMLEANHSVILFPSTRPQPKAFVVEPLAGNPAEFNWFGFSREMEPLH